MGGEGGAWANAGREEAVSSWASATEAWRSVDLPDDTFETLHRIVSSRLLYTTGRRLSRPCCGLAFPMAMSRRVSGADYADLYTIVHNQIGEMELVNTKIYQLHQTHQQLKKT